MAMRSAAPTVGHAPPILVAAAAQVAALACVALGAALAVQLTGSPLRGSLLVWLVGGLAMVLGSRWGLPRWWHWIQLLFAPALFWALQLALPPWIWLAGLVLCGLMLGNSVFDRVPLYLSSTAVWEALQGELRPGTRMLDLGSGLGGGLAWLAPRHPEVHFVGVESSPLLWLVSRLRLARHPNAEVRWHSLWSVTLADYALVYAFLSPAPMARLWRKVETELVPGALFVSNSFTVPGVRADQRMAVDDRRGSVLYLWRR